MLGDEDVTGTGAQCGHEALELVVSLLGSVGEPFLLTVMPMMFGGIIVFLMQKTAH